MTNHDFVFYATVVLLLFKKHLGFAIRSCSVDPACSTALTAFHAVKKKEGILLNEAHFIWSSKIKVKAVYHTECISY